jgi:hypothetical protein
MNARFFAYEDDEAPLFVQCSPRFRQLANQPEPSTYHKVLPSLLPTLYRLAHTCTAMAKVEQVKKVMDEVYGKCLDPRNWVPKKYKDTKSR